MGSVSGSGTATTVSLGSVTLAGVAPRRLPERERGRHAGRGGHRRDPVAADVGGRGFIIAEYLGVPYLTVLVWAIVPTILYYLGILLAVEIDARRYGTREVDVDAAVDLAAARQVRLSPDLAGDDRRVPRHGRVGDAGQSSTRPPCRSCCRTWTANTGSPRRRLYGALATGVRGVLSVAAVCAAAGVIAAMITRTGLGLQLNSILVNTARSITENPTAVLIFTALFAALAVSVLGLAVPVTASFVISWVIVGPALQDLGVAAPAVAMFVFYFAVLSEVTPPTALAAVAASAITGGRVIPTMMADVEVHAARFLVPFAFVLTDNGEGLLGLRSFVRHGVDGAVGALAVAALAVVTGGGCSGGRDGPNACCACLLRRCCST